MVAARPRAGESESSGTGLLVQGRPERASSKWAAPEHSAIQQVPWSLPGPGVPVGECVLPRKGGLLETPQTALPAPDAHLGCPGWEGTGALSVSLRGGVVGERRW